jgi:hypothetical protein
MIDKIWTPIWIWVSTQPQLRAARILLQSWRDQLSRSAPSEKVFWKKKEKKRAGDGFAGRLDDEGQSDGLRLSDSEIQRCSDGQRLLKSHFFRGRICAVRRSSKG